MHSGGPAEPTLDGANSLSALSMASEHQLPSLPGSLPLPALYRVTLLHPALWLPSLVSE